MSRNIAVVLCVVLGACTSPGSSGSETIAAPTLTGSEIMTLYSGNTLKGSNWVEFYDSNGTVRGISKGEKYSGSWRVEGDRVCIEMATWDYDDCLVVQQSGTKYKSSGEETQGTTFTVESGNVQGL